MQGRGTRLRLHRKRSRSQDREHLLSLLLGDHHLETRIYCDVRRYRRGTVPFLRSCHPGDMEGELMSRFPSAVIGGCILSCLIAALVYADEERSTMERNVRKPAVAGQFYTADPTALRKGIVHIGRRSGQYSCGPDRRHRITPRGLYLLRLRCGPRLPPRAWKTVRYRRRYRSQPYRTLRFLLRLRRRRIPHSPRGDPDRPEYRRSHNIEA